ALAAAQRLIRKVCPDCKEQISIPRDVLERIQFRATTHKEPPLWVRGRGCTKCKNLGYKGRLAVIEAMPNYPELEPLILGRAASTQIKDMAVKCGMRTLRQNALSKAARGQTTIEEVLRVTAAD